MAVKKVSNVLKTPPIPNIVDENGAIQLEQIKPKFRNGTKKAIILGFEATTPVYSNGRLLKRAKVIFGIGEDKLNQNLLLVNYPGQLIYQLFMVAVGRIDNVTKNDLLNKEVGIELKNVVTDKGRYTNVTRIFDVSELESEEDSHESHGEDEFNM